MGDKNVCLSPKAATKKLSGKPARDGNYIRHATFPVSYQFKWNRNGKIIYEGLEFSAETVKMKILFSQPYCACCGLGGRYWALEKEKGRNGNLSKPYHFNMYGIEPKYGMEIMLTHDHIKPKSKNGTMSMDNAQTLCEACNNVKGNMENIPNELLKELSGLFIEVKHLRANKSSRRDALKAYYFSLLIKKKSYKYDGIKDLSLFKLNTKLLWTKIQLFFVWK